ncbi:hypothetical protein [Calycomorphotria hydatis]|uniref:Uncharacterized protein n=1 Tax=Calycomorphotria hydatis TaxID=2528027 RepID=A0A517T3G0_9PLAN|nr:hypothetical protein [Calycomorphotria hydatis]QDT62906.1 hypothetical protein V22_01040 [Calycomorphotria hydatis]
MDHEQLISPEQLSRKVRTMQIIAAALMNGVVVFGIVAFVITGGPKAAEQFPLLSTIAAGFAGFAVFLSIIVGLLIDGRSLGSPVQMGQTGTRLIDRARRDGMPEEALAEFQEECERVDEEFAESRHDVWVELTIGGCMTRMIIRYAILEGAAMFNLVAFIIEQQWFSLAVVLVLLGITAFHFPTVSAIRHALEDRARMEDFESGLS